MYLCAAIYNNSISVVVYLISTFYGYFLNQIDFVHLSWLFCFVRFFFYVECAHEWYSISAARLFNGRCILMSRSWKMPFFPCSDFIIKFTQKLSVYFYFGARIFFEEKEKCDAEYNLFHIKQNIHSSFEPETFVWRSLKINAMCMEKERKRGSQTAFFWNSIESIWHPVRWGTDMITHSFNIGEGNSTNVPLEREKECTQRQIERTYIEFHSCMHIIPIHDLLFLCTEPNADEKHAGILRFKHEC